MWSAVHFRSVRDAAMVAGSELRECARLADELRQLKQRPMVAGTEDFASKELSTLVESAAADAGIPASSLLRISPESPYRIGDTAYLQKPTQVQLQQVTLSQLFALLHGLSLPERKLQVQSLRLSAPRRNEAGRDWAVELIVSYLIYSPRHVSGESR